MPKAAPQAPPAPASLVQVLSDLGLDARRAPKKSFADRLAELIDLSGAIDLSEFLRSLGRIPAQTLEADEAAEATSSPGALFQARRRDMLRTISASFVPPQGGEPAPAGGFFLPSPKPATLKGDAEAWAPYQRFYSLQQSELERQVTLLRRALRQQLTVAGPALAQLAALDVTLDGTLADYARRGLAVLPGLLQKRFVTLAGEQRAADAAAGDSSEPGAWLEEGGWLRQFHRDMQRVLVAEVSLRLQPLQGMLDALESVDEDAP